MGLENVCIKPNFPKVNGFNIFDLTGFIASACVRVNVRSFLLAVTWGMNELYLGVGVFS